MIEIAEDIKKAVELAEEHAVLEKIQWDVFEELEAKYAVAPSAEVAIAAMDARYAAEAHDKAQTELWRKVADWTNCHGTVALRAVEVITSEYHIRTNALSELRRERNLAIDILRTQLSAQKGA